MFEFFKIACCENKARPRLRAGNRSRQQEQAAGAAGGRTKAPYVKFPGPLLSFPGVS